MDKINLNDVLFHGLTNFLVGPGRFEKSIERLNLILKSNAILSRNKQKEILPKIGLTPPEYIKTLWNGNDYISVCSKLSKNQSNIKNSEAYEEFINYSYGLIINKSILDELDCRDYCFSSEGKHKCQDGEIQIKDAIPASYFVGIFTCDLSDAEIIESSKGFNITSTDILRTFVSSNVLRELLNSNGYENLPIYSIRDGNIITSAEHVLTILNNKESTQESEDFSL